MKKAVAVKYSPKHKKEAPRVIAKGQGKTAEEIIKIAKENDIVTYEDKDVVEILSKVNLGDEIPPELYEAVAEILAFVYRINGKLPE